MKVFILMLVDKLPQDRVLFGSSLHQVVMLFLKYQEGHITIHFPNDSGKKKIPQMLLTHLTLTVFEFTELLIIRRHQSKGVKTL